jgi:glycosyltransferase involved in cell wall biosynthesis
MRIAIDVRSLMEGRHSGVEEYTTQIIRAMVRVAPKHEYHLFYNSTKKVKLPDFGEQVKVHGFRYPNKILNLSQFLVERPHWDELVQADCFFVPNFRLTPLGQDVPLVTTVHDLSFERFPELFSWRRRVWHKLMRPWVLMHNSDKIIAVSEATKKDVVDLYQIYHRKIKVIYSGVTGMDSNEDRRELMKKRYNLPDKFVMYLGTLEPRKNVSGIIQAFDAIASEVEHDLVIAGANGWLMGEIDRALNNSRGRSRIHLTGFISEEDKWELYKMANLFVYPSLYEGFGFPPLEALLSGTPVITSNNSSLPEVVGKWATLIDPFDTAELALVMKELLNELPVVEESVRREIREKYLWDRAAKETLDVIESVV